MLPWPSKPQASKPGNAQALTFNAAGSPAHRLLRWCRHRERGVGGFGHGQGSDFDTPLLADLAPAVFIATPVLKALDVFQMPYGVEWLGALARGWDRNQAQAYFIYGGNWLVDPVSPEGTGGQRARAARLPTSRCCWAPGCRACGPMIGCSFARARVRQWSTAVRGYCCARGQPHLTNLEAPARHGLTHRTHRRSLAMGTHVNLVHIPARHATAMGSTPKAESPYAHTRTVRLRLPASR